jgi:hypothetical protein
MNKHLYELLFVKLWRGKVRHYTNKKVYVVDGLAKRVTDSGRVSWDIVYHPQGKPDALYTQNIKRFCGISKGVARFEVVA